MTRQQIVLEQVPNQEITVDIGENSFDFKFKTTSEGLFVDMAINGEQIFYGARCCNLMPLVLNQNTMTGNFYFEDNNGNDDPSYQFFNDRFLFIYDSDYVANNSGN